MKRIAYIFCFLFILLPEIYACTSAIVGSSLNPYGRPLLWKNRDTSAKDNKIDYVKGEDGNFSYVALFNATDKELKEAWMGMNEYGFAIMNTASYNIKNDSIPEKDMDKEGLVMTEALKSCKTVDDFAHLLEKLPKPLGVEANFGVIDAYGDGAYFETNNYDFVRFNLSDSPDDILIRTNYSKSGRKEEGYGFIREANAVHLLEPYIEKKSVTPEILTEELSHSFYHSLLNEDFAQSGQKWVIDQDFIPRFTTTASIVIEGCKPLDKSEKPDPNKIISEYVMWSELGYPPCAEVFPVRCCEEGVADDLKGIGPDGRSPQCDKVLERKNKVFPFKKGNGEKYIDMTQLINENGSGYMQQLVPINRETYIKIRNINN